MKGWFTAELYTTFQKEKMLLGCCIDYFNCCNAVAVVVFFFVLQSPNNF